MRDRIWGVVYVLLGGVPLYMVLGRGKQFMFPPPVAYALCGAMILYGLYVLVRPRKSG